MTDKIDNTIPDAPPIRQEIDTAVEGESAGALFVKPGADISAEQGEVPEMNAAPTQTQTGVQAESPTQVQQVQAEVARQMAAPISNAATQALRAAAAKEQAEQGASAQQALETQQAAQAQSSIVPSGLELSRPLAKAVVVDTGSKTANAVGVSTLRDINGTAPKRTTNAAGTTGVNDQGNIVRTNPRLLAAQAAKEAQKLESAKLKEDLDKILADVPAAYRSDIIRLEQYCVTMAPGRPVSDTQGAAEQMALFRLLQNIINRQTTYFVPLFDAVLRVFRAHANGALGDAYRNRFGHHIPLSRQERNALQKITHLLSIMADPKTRATAGKIVDIEAALEDGLTDDGRNRVISYFG